MVKVALCISGQSRFFKECYSNIYNNIIKPYNCDIFMHFWENKNTDSEWTNTGPTYTKNTKIKALVNKNSKEEVIKLYSPNKFICECPIDFNNTNNENYITKKNRDYFNTNKITHCLFYSMFYSIYKANELKKEYENENNFKYDCVIKLRFDCLIQEPIRLNIGSNKFCNINNSRIIADRIFYSSSKSMDIITSLYKHIDIPVSNDVVFVWQNIKYIRNEGMVNWWLKKNNIEVEVSNVKYKLYGR